MKKLLYVISLCSLPFSLWAQEDFTIQNSISNDEVLSVSDRKILENSLGGGILVQSFAPPLNDNCANATGISIGTTLLNQTTIQATIQSGESFGCVSTADQSVWYSFVATSMTHYVTITLTATSGCYFSSAIWGPGAVCLPTSDCMALSCQAASNGPLTHEHVLTNLTIGQTYYVQVIYNSAGACGGGNPSTVGVNFSIRVANTGTQTFPSNPAPMSTWQSPSGPACVFCFQPTVAQVTSSCPSYSNPVTGPSITNEVVRACFTILSGPCNTTNFIQNIISSTCGAGNVIWLKWEIRDMSGNLIACGTLNSLQTPNLQCQKQYMLCLSYEIPNCVHTLFYPYIYSTITGCVLLPVELISFKAVPKKEEVEISWQTASEINNDYFILERSINGIDFEEILKVSGFGTTNAVKDYKEYDREPLRGISYYRLKQVDFDGTTEISSDIVSVNFMSSNDQMFYYVNAENLFTFKTDTKGTFSLFTIEGRVLMNFEVYEGEQVFNLSRLPEGMYIYQFVIDKDRVFRGKIVR